LLKDSLPTIPSGFSVRSCRVHAGSWQVFSGECFSDHQCVLEEGFYPDLRTMGFSEPDASVLSLQPTGLELSVPALLLFERSGLRGRRTPLKTASKQVHFRLRNKEAGLLMSVCGSLDDIKLMRIQVSEESGGAEQIWTYQDGHLQCKCSPFYDPTLISAGGQQFDKHQIIVNEFHPDKLNQRWSLELL
ncbi:hypothetical protein cypCar_00029197, partial [Cyprinus carpio]